jgi:DNA transformation protein and related proteins
MRINNGFVEHLLELMQPMGAISARKMFGGYGIYRAGLMFGLVADDVLYLKVDGQNRSQFSERELEPFVFMKEGRPVEMSYCRAPEEALDDPDEMGVWAEIAYQAALRSQKPKKQK